MKGGCVVALAFGLGTMAIGLIGGGIFVLGWTKDNFGDSGFGFAAGAILIFVVVVFCLCIFGAIGFGLSGLWVKALSELGLMGGTVAGSMADAVRYSRLPHTSQPAQPKPVQEPQFEPMISHGDQPGRFALPGGQAAPQQGYSRPQLTQPVQYPVQPQTDAWGRPIGRQAAHNEVMAR